MLHQQLCAAGGVFEGSHLLLEVVCLVPCRLILHQGIVDLASGVEQRLFEAEACLLLLRFGYAELGDVRSPVEQRLRQRGHGGGKELARVDDHRTCRVCPAGAAAQRDRGVEGGTGGVGSVECLCQRLFGTAHVGAVGEHLQGHAHRKVLRQALLGEASAGKGAGDVGKEQRKGVLHLVELFAQVEQGSTYIVVCGLSLREGGFGHHSGSFHGAGGGDALFPGGFGGGGDLDLGVEHQQRIVVVGDGGNQLRLYRLFIVTALRHDSLCTPLGVRQPAEDVDLPTGADGQ